jgi:hypothetical protein
MRALVINRVAIVTLALGWAGSIGAHHSESMFAPEAVWVTGTVVAFSRVNPHAVILVEEAGSDGNVRRWAVEGRSLAQLDGLGIGADYLSVGDEIEVCAFPRRQASASGADGAPPFVHGLVLAKGNGEMILWGTYGKLTNCVRPEDEAGLWVGFLRREDPFFSEWCWKTAEIPTQELSKPLVGEIDRLIGNPCD